MYSAQVLDHFKNPRNAGELPGATAVAEASNPVCGDTLHLWARIESGKFAAVRFKAVGCATSIACGSVLTELLAGNGIAEARQITPGSIAAALGGLPPETQHGSALAADALAILLEKVTQKSP